MELLRENERARIAVRETNCAEKEPALQTSGVFNSSAGQLLNDVVSIISRNFGEARKASFLFQRI